MASGAGSWWDSWFAQKKPQQVSQLGRVADPDPYARVPRGVPLAASARGLGFRRMPTVSHIQVPFTVQSVIDTHSVFSPPDFSSINVSPGGGVGDSGDGAASGGGDGGGDGGDGGGAAE